MIRLAGGGSIEIPYWLVAVTMAAYMGFFIGFGETIFNFDFANCTGVISCSSVMFDVVTSLFNLITFGGFRSPLPVIIQGPLLIFGAIAWGPRIAQLIMNAVGAVVP